MQGSLQVPPKDCPNEGGHGGAGQELDVQLPARHQRGAGQENTLCHIGT